jgi:hypothetical protein
MCVSQMQVSVQRDEILGNDIIPDSPHEPSVEVYVDCNDSAETNDILPVYDAFSRSVGTRKHHPANLILKN